ncbi:hypothetical protein Bpfe_031210 [Biomphalaria pfeifferi]|uniref:Uncharacterized protein n=1 Tax=Biomphalaria pfeifferi TaxID=112525 RepID=A0AAD8ET45_BIOPF|nr:hypothetical protein Bpfe_031210 [Biomphalaria pfeifferi]
MFRAHASRRSAVKRPSNPIRRKIAEPTRPATINAVKNRSEFTNQRRGNGASGFALSAVICQRRISLQNQNAARKKSGQNDDCQRTDPDSSPSAE